VLVIDDDPSVRQLITRTLSDAGFDAIAVGTAREGLDVLGGGRSIALVLLDLAMPGMDGFEFRRHQLASPGMAAVPVVVLTGASLPSIDDASLQAADYLLKPVGRAHLVSVVSAYCRPRV
jgi:CheY-like chemotaxis protein